MHNILLDHLLSFTTLLVLDDVSHAGLVTHEGSEVDGGRGVVAGERSNATVMMSGPALGQEGEGTATGVFELTMGHGI